MGYSANWGFIMDLFQNSRNCNNNDNSSISSSSRSSSNDDNDDDNNTGTESPLKRRKLDNGSNSSDFTVINLWDSKYSRSKEPLMSSCSCYSCKSHSRAYIHHLLIAHELLGEILLYRHNLHQFTTLMELFGNLNGSVDRSLPDGCGGPAKLVMDAVLNALR